jgi:8-amino-7-oxononanoate synthase
MGSDAYAWIDQAMQTIHRAGWYRSAIPITILLGPTLTLDDQTLLNFASNDYPGFAGDPRLIAAAVEAARAYGTGNWSATESPASAPCTDNSNRPWLK